MTLTARLVRPQACSALHFRLATRFNAALSSEMRPSGKWQPMGVEAGEWPASESAAVCACGCGRIRSAEAPIVGCPCTFLHESGALL